MIRSGFKSKAPPARPATQWTGDALPGPRSQPERVSDGLARAIVPVPKGPKSKSGKRTPTKAEAEWMSRIVSHGCVACGIDGTLTKSEDGVYEPVRPEVHHILRGGRRVGHLFTLPLCTLHHRGESPHARHPYKARFEARYGSELDLLARLKRELGYFDDWKAT